MKKVFHSKVFILAVLFIVAISAFSFLAYNKACTACSQSKECLKVQPDGSSEMLLDVLSRQFVSTVRFQ
jgi:hypothetical protein